MRVILIAAVASNGVIGNADGGIPWSLPADTRHFQQSVRGKCLLLGRRTYEEMRGWFQDETVIVLSTQGDIRSVDAALAKAERQGAEELWVCGGAATYAAAMERADAMILTHIDVRIPAGVCFPKVDMSEWTVVRREFRPADEANEYGMTFVWYERRAVDGNSLASH